MLKHGYWESDYRLHNCLKAGDEFCLTCPEKMNRKQDEFLARVNASDSYVS